MAGRIEARLIELGIRLVDPPAPVGAYVPAVLTRGLAFTSGQLPMLDGALTYRGKVGSELTEEEGQAAARLAVTNALMQLRALLGDLDRVRSVVRLEGYVNSGPGFSRQPIVLNGASELLQQVFGESGRHTRVALGVAEMPLDAAVQIALWVEVDS